MMFRVVIIKNKSPQISPLSLWRGVGGEVQTEKNKKLLPK